MKNIDQKTVDGFGQEWNKYNQSSIPMKELEKSWNQYFDIFPFEKLHNDSQGFDMGCGSGRWAKFVANKVNHLNCVDPSIEALDVAKRNLSNYSNVSFYHGSANENPLAKNSQDFGYCLGVLHHIPDTLEGIKACSKLLKKDAPFLLYLYYDFENRSTLFKLIWKISNIFRKFISLMPRNLKIITTSIIAFFVYYPLARTALIFENLGVNVSKFLLTDYRKKSFYFMRTDALDRFGTQLEKRFSREKISHMLKEAGFKDITFSNNMPFWVCVSYKM